MLNSMNNHSLEFTVKKLGNRLYELRRLVSGGWMAYSVEIEQYMTEPKALMAQGNTLKEALENLLKLLDA